MIADAFDSSRDVGKTFETLMRTARERTISKNDDFILPIVGLTGTGKSNLGLWVQSIVVPEPKVEQIGLTQKDFARALMLAKESDVVQRYVQYDEGSMNRREWQSTWSRDLLALYHDIRSLRIFHVWCTAYPDLLDRVFIKERVGGLVYIYTKDVDRPRLFLYFTKDDLLKFLDQNGRITTDLLKKFGKQHATLQSWFRAYHGPMLSVYAERKNTRVDERVDGFFKKYGVEEVDGVVEKKETPKERVCPDCGLLSFYISTRKQQAACRNGHTWPLLGNLTNFTNNLTRETKNRIEGTRRSL